MLGSLKAGDPETIRSYAACDVYEAEMLQEQPSGNKNPKDLANKAIERLRGLESAGDPRPGDLFLRGLAQAIQDDNDSAIESLRSAVLRGFNMVQRFQTHRDLGLRSLVAEPGFRDRLERNCIQVARKKIIGIDGTLP